MIYCIQTNLKDITHESIANELPTRACYRPQGTRTAR